MRTFADRWKVPETSELMAEWHRNLTLINDACECPDGYHLLWGGLRLARQNIGLYWESRQLRDLLVEPIANAKDILIAGSADHIALALLNDISGTNRNKRYHVIDRCPAPLQIVKAYAQTHSLNLITSDWDLGEPLPKSVKPDLIFMHYTLDFVPAPLRARVLINLANSLTDKGLIIMVHRKRAKARQASQVSEWASRVLADLPNEARQDPRLHELLEKHLLAYGASRANRAIDENNNDVLLDQVQQAGLRVITAQPTIRSDKLSDSFDTDRAKEHSTVFVLGIA